MIADSLDKQFTFHDVCDENHDRRVESRIKALLASIGVTHLEKVRFYDTWYIN
jgi:hypothetical protein